MLKSSEFKAVISGILNVLVKFSIILNVTELLILWMIFKTFLQLMYALGMVTNFKC